MDFFCLFLLLLSVKYVNCGFKELLQSSMEDVAEKQNKTKCDEALNRLLNNILHPTLDDLWGYKMIDASSSVIPDGVLLGNVGSMGNFEECLSIISKDRTIEGQYCLKLVIPIPGLDKAITELVLYFMTYSVSLSAFSHTKSTNTTLKVNLELSYPQLKKVEVYDVCVAGHFTHR
nr:unnamed protein product [Callosobruchus chinensis]